MPKHNVTFKPLTTENLHLLKVLTQQNGNDVTKTYAQCMSMVGLIAAVMDIKKIDLLNHAEMNLELGKKILEKYPSIFDIS